MTESSDLLRIVASQAAAIERLTLEADRLRSALAASEADRDRLADAVYELSRAIPESISDHITEWLRDLLNKTEQNILEAVSGTPERSQRIAEVAGYTPDIATRILPRLVRLGLVEHCATGYRRCGHTVGTERTN